MSDAQKLSLKQRNHLRDRLTQLWRVKERLPDGPEPKRVVEARLRLEASRKIVDIHEVSRYKLQRQLREQVNAAATLVEEAILFGDPDKALAALKRFEATTFRVSKGGLG